MDASRKTIPVAFLVGGILVATAFYFKLQVPAAEPIDSLAVVATADIPRERIEAADSDGDGVPDWQEALQRDEPIFTTELVDVYVPETLTEQFALDYFQDFMFLQSSNLAQDGTSLAEQAVQQVSDVARDDLYGANDIRVSDNNSVSAVKNYGNAMALAAAAQTLEGETLGELEILRQAYTLDQPEMLERLDPIIAGYEELIADSLAIAVPTDYVKEHLDLVNVYNSILIDVQAMKAGFDDPIQVLVRLKRYQEDADSLYVVLLNLQKKMIVNGVQFSEVDPAYRFIVR